MCSVNRNLQHQHLTQPSTKHTRHTLIRKSLNPARKSSLNLFTHAWAFEKRQWSGCCRRSSSIRPLHCNLPLRISFQTHFSAVRCGILARKRERVSIFTYAHERASSAVWANYRDRVAPYPPVTPLHEMLRV